MHGRLAAYLVMIWLEIYDRKQLTQESPTLDDHGLPNRDKGIVPVQQPHRWYSHVRYCSCKRIPMRQVTKTRQSKTLSLVR